MVRNAPIERRKIAFAKLDVPWKGVFENWSKGYVRKHFWKVSEHFLAEEDALAECALIFTKCLRSYEYRVDNHNWFMSLYQRAVSNDFTTYADRSTKQRSFICHTRDDEDEAAVEAQGGVEDHSGYLLSLLSNASEELQLVLVIIATAPADVLDILLHITDDITMNRRWKRWCGIKNPSANLVEELKTLLS